MKVINGSIEFKRPNIRIEEFVVKHKEIERYTTLHTVDLVDVYMDKEGRIHYTMVDYYDFSYMDEESKNIVKQQLIDANNRAYYQQKKGKIKPYIIYKKYVYKY